MCSRSEPSHLLLSVHLRLSPDIPKTFVGSVGPGYSSGRLQTLVRNEQGDLAGFVSEVWSDAGLNIPC